MSQGEKKQLGRILLQQRALTPEELDRALSDRATGRLASRLTAQGTISDIAALKALSEQHGIPGIDLGQVCLRLEDLDLLPREIAEKHLILPVLVRDERLFVAMANPRERKVIDELEFVTGKKVYPYVALETVLQQVLEVAYTLKARGQAFYVGARCPPALLQKLGLEPNAPASSAAAQSAKPESVLLGADDDALLEAPGVIVDDAVGRVSRADDVEDAHFGDTSKELSVVAELPPEHHEPVQPGVRILVVDDEDDIRKLLKRLLSGRGHQVLEADSGLAALRAVKEQAPDLIVLDAMLPEVHGFEIARRIKGSKRYGHVPIIMVSAVYRGWRYAEDLKQTCGVDHFIEKPFRISDIVRAVDDCLTRASGRPSAPPECEQISAEAEQALNEGVEAYKAGQLELAVEHLKRGIGIDPLAYRLHFHLGLLYGKRGQVYDAIGELETAVEINAKHFPAVKNLAVLYQKAGFRNKAAEAWERALKLAPDDATRQSIRQHLLSLL